MYLKTTRRVRKRRGIGFGRIALWLLAPILIFVGIGIYQNRESYIPIVSNLVNSVVVQAEDVVSTIQAPTPTASPDPGNAVERAQSAWEQGAFQDAVKLYESVIGAVPNEMQSHYFLALGLINEGRLQDALVAAEDTVTANPFASDAWAIRAMALNEAGRYGEAIASALRALELNPESARAHAFLAEAFLELGQVERALTEVEEAIALDSSSFEAYFVRARIKAEAQLEFEAAQKDFEIAYKDSGKMPYIGVYLANEYIYRDREDTESGEKGMGMLREMNERNPNNTLVLVELGLYYRDIVGDLNQASTYLTRCVSTTPDSIDCQFWLGRVQNEQEEPELAAETLMKTMELGSTNPRHFYWVGQTQLDLGNCASAAEYLDEGYKIAQETNSEWLDDIETLIRSLTCGSFDLPTLTPTETPDLSLTPTPEA